MPEVCREHGMSNPKFYNWRSKFGGFDVSMVERLKELEVKNKRLKKMYAEERIKAEILQEIMEGKLCHYLCDERWRKSLYPTGSLAFV